MARRQIATFPPGNPYLTEEKPQSAELQAERSPLLALLEVVAEAEEQNGEADQLCCAGHQAHHKPAPGASECGKSPKCIVRSVRRRDSEPYHCRHNTPIIDRCAPAALAALL